MTKDERLTQEQMAKAIADHFGVFPSECAQTASIALDAGYKPEDFEMTCGPQMVTKPGVRGRGHRQPPAIKIKARGK